MKHAAASTLARLEPLLGPLRHLGVLVERTPGCFYRKSKAFLHFHEEGEKLFADVRLGEPGFTRFEVSHPDEQRRLLAELRRHLEG